MGNSLLNFDDFLHPKYSILFENVTTGTSVEDSILLAEINDTELLLELPGRKCAVGHPVLIRISPVNDRQKPDAFTATGKVVEVTRADQGRESVRIKLVQYDSESWHAFVGSFLQRQEEIMRMIESNHA